MKTDNSSRKHVMKVRMRRRMAVSLTYNAKRDTSAGHWILLRVLPADLIMGHRMNVPSPMNPVTCLCRGCYRGKLLMNKAATSRHCFPACIQTFSIYINLNFKRGYHIETWENYFLKAFWQHARCNWITRRRQECWHPVKAERPEWRKHTCNNDIRPWRSDEPSVLLGGVCVSGAEFKINKNPKKLYNLAVETQTVYVCNSQSHFIPVWNWSPQY